MFIGALATLFAFDSFSGDTSIGEKLLGFLIGLTPGVTILAVVYFLWCKERILGVVLSVLGIVMIYFFSNLQNFPNELERLLIPLPIFIIGIILIIFGRNKQKGCCKIK